MSSVVRLNPYEAFQKQKEGYVYLDVRTVEEYEAGHPAGSVNIPLMHHGASAGMVPNPEFLALVECRFLRETPLVIGCHAGGRSLRAAQMLLHAGYTDLYEQRAGWGGTRDPFGQVMEEGWLDAGLPVEA